LTLTPLQIEQLLESYLEGRLSDADRIAFERTMVAQPDLREQVVLQRELDASLGRLFACSAARTAEEPHIKPAVWVSTRGSRRLLFPLAAAAAVLLAGLGAWLFASRPAAIGGSHPLQVAYTAQVDNGFRPEVVCTGTAEFADWMRKYFGQPLYPTQSDGVQLVGWAYAPVISARSGILLARSGETPIVIVVDYAVRERKPFPSLAGGGLHEFREQMGSVVLYEVSPLDHAVVLPLLSTNAPPGLKSVSGNNPANS
jgi:hypothetical protein